MTNDEINEACAVEVMEWKENYWGHFVNPGVRNWNPLQSGDDCFTILDRLEELGLNYDLVCNKKKYDGKYLVVVYKTLKHILTVIHDSKTRAICEAAILAVRWLKEQKNE